jgi:hypothetical protein
LVQPTRAPGEGTAIGHPPAVGRPSAAGIVFRIGTTSNQAAFDVGWGTGAAIRYVLAPVFPASGSVNADTTSPRVGAAAAPVEHREGGQRKEGEDIDGLHFVGLEVRLTPLSKVGAMCVCGKDGYLEESSRLKYFPSRCLNEVIQPEPGEADR